jgi:hypothetical protein
MSKMRDPNLQYLLFYTAVVIVVVGYYLYCLSTKLQPCP